MEYRRMEKRWPYCRLHPTGRPCAPTPLKSKMRSFLAVDGAVMLSDNPTTFSSII